MRLLAQDTLVSKDMFQLGPVVEKAFEEAQKHHTPTNAKLNFKSAERVLLVPGDKHALTFALAEVFLNGLQSNSKDVKMTVRVQTETADDGTTRANLEIQDNGPGFTAEALLNAGKPFYRTKVLGLGLGLAVAQKVVEMHQGKMAVSNVTDGQGACVRISLPLESSSAGKR